MIIRIDLPNRMILGDHNEVVIKISDVVEKPVVYFDPAETATEKCVKPSDTMLLAFSQELINQFKAAGKERCQETYAMTVRRFVEWHQGEDVLLEEIDGVMMEDFEAYLKQRGCTLNTVSFYMRVLRSIYNKAVRRLLIADKRPFTQVFTGNAKTSKRAVSIDTIRKLATYKTDVPMEQLARDLFLFSFYTRGMSFVDIAYLRNTDIRDKVLAYKRKKTGGELRMAWHEKMQDIVDRHPSLDGEHLLGILDNRRKDNLRFQYHQVQGHIGVCLKRISHALKLPVPLTMYMARHSWATIARDKQVPMSVISDGMGHHTERTTQIYLRSVDAQLIDHANDMLIREITEVH